MQRIVHEVKGETQGKESPTKEIGATSSNFVQERIVNEVEGEPQGNETPTGEIGATSLDIVQERGVDEREGEIVQEVSQEVSQKRLQERGIVLACACAFCFEHSQNLIIRLISSGPALMEGIFWTYISL
ncbi:hypothetical protein LguiA_003351 [Lonicera macranthoides]